MRWDLMVNSFVAITQSTWFQRSLIRAGLASPRQAWEPRSSGFLSVQTGEEHHPSVCPSCGRQGGELAREERAALGTGNMGDTGDGWSQHSNTFRSPAAAPEDASASRNAGSAGLREKGFNQALCCEQASLQSNIVVQLRWEKFQVHFYGKKYQEMLLETHLPPLIEEQQSELWLLKTKLPTKGLFF